MKDDLQLTYFRVDVDETQYAIIDRWRRLNELSDKLLEMNVSLEDIDVRYAAVLMEPDEWFKRIDKCIDELEYYITEYPING